MKQAELKLLCGKVQPNGKVCTRTAYSESSGGLCYHHSPLTASRRRRYASRGGQRGGRGHLSTKVARREIRDLKRVCRFLAGHAATDTLEYAIPKGPVAWHVDKTLELVKNYIRLCELEIKFGMTEEESHRADVLDAEEIRRGIEDLVHGEDAHDEYDKLDDPGLS